MKITVGSLACDIKAYFCLLPQYSRRLAQGKALLFSQKDIPMIRKRIYKELCDCELCEES